MKRVERRGVLRGFRDVGFAEGRWTWGVKRVVGRGVCGEG